VIASFHLNPKTGDFPGVFQYFLDEKAYWNALTIPRTAENAEKAEEEDFPVLRELPEPPSPSFWHDYGINTAICQDKSARGV